MGLDVSLIFRGFPNPYFGGVKPAFFYGVLGSQFVIEGRSSTGNRPKLVSEKRSSWKVDMKNEHTWLFRVYRGLYYPVV